MFTDDIGSKIKEIRRGKDLTLSDLSEMTGLSTGYLSQLERGLTTIAIDTLNNLSKVLEVDISEFIEMKKKDRSLVQRSYEREVSQIVNNQFIYYELSNNLEDKEMLPRLIEILPGQAHEKISTYNHSGEEFIHVIEGILTLVLENDEEFELYPGDNAHYSSTINHNWVNNTNRTVKLLSVHLTGK